MAKLSKDEQQRIVEREMPGYRVVERRTRGGGAAGDAQSADARGAAPAEARSPDIDTLRRKYLGEEGARNGARRTAEPSPRGERAARPSGDRRAPAGAAAREDDAAAPARKPDEAEDTVTTVQAENAFDPAIGAPGEKKVVLGGKEKRIIARQG